jgi:adenylate cyclase
VIRRVRLVSGLIMFSYLISHFTNHALGLVSLDTMEDALSVLYPFWTHPLPSTALYGAATVHFSLALWALWQRRTLRRMQGPAVVQYVLGFCVPLLAMQHVMFTRVGDSFFGGNFGYYTNVLAVFWRLDPVAGALQAVLVVVAWVHACIGLRYWLRLKPWYQRVQPFLYAGALLLPVLALLGAAEAGREVLDRLARDPDLLGRIEAGRVPAAAQVFLTDVVWWGRLGVLGAIAGVLAARVGRRRWQGRKGLIRVSYPSGQSIAVVPGTTVLEASRMLRIPHASVCGGKGRCSTCRVRVRAAPNALPPPSALETAVLRRIGAAPNIRLACQLRPRADVEAVPMLPPFVDPREGFRRSGHLLGREKEIAILFADLRAFTRLAETKLPYDVVFLLNRYFAAMGNATEEAGGRVDKFIGDGIMALFGIDDGAAAGCRNALEAARLMSLRIDDLNREIAADIDAPLRIGIGIHVGPVIVGEMGYGPATQLTAVGDAVNTASRLEALSKEFSCELVVSEEVASKAGADLSAYERHDVEIRGRRQPLGVWAVERGKMLAAPGIA